MALAHKLIDQGNAAGDALTAYAALKLALDIGNELGESEIAFAAIDGMGRKFDIEPLATKVNLLEAMLKARAVTVAANRAPWVEKILSLIQEALAAEKPDPAERLLVIVRPMSKAVRDSATVTKRVQTLAKAVAESQQLQAEVEKARQRLETQPDDPEANQRMGAYLCFLKGNWDEGLPRLAKAADAGLRQLAQSELSNATFVNQQYALAKAWWALADTQGVKARRQILLHASHWYEVAEPNLSGDEEGTGPYAHARRSGQHVDRAEPADHVKPADHAKPTGHGKPTGHAKPADHAKPAAHAKPADHAEPADRDEPAPAEKADKDQE